MILQTFSLNIAALESSLGSLGSSEQLPDSDSEQEEASHRPMIQCSEMSIDEDQASYRDSLDLSSLSTSHADPEQDGEQDLTDQERAEPPVLPQDLTDQERADPPMLPDSEPPDDEAEKDLGVSLAELNVNQSNNNVPCSPILRSVSGIQLTPLCGKKLPLTRNRDSQPEFV